MKIAGILGAASVVTLVSAQIEYINGTIYCPIANGTYCAGANIIVRCLNGVGQPGNCDDNLAGEPPVGVNPASCFQCSATAGAAACSKNGIVYPDSGTGLGSTPFLANSTTICSNTTAASSSINPGGPIINATFTSTSTCKATYVTVTATPAGPSCNATFVTVTSTSGSGAAPVASSTSSGVAVGAITAGTTTSTLNSSSGVAVGAITASASTSTPGSSSASSSPTLVAYGTTTFTPGSSSASAAATYTGDAASNMHVKGAGAALGFGALFVAVGML